MSGKRIKLPKDPMNDYSLDEFLMKTGPLDAAKLCGLHSKIDIFYDDCFDPSWFRVPNEKATDAGDVRDM